MIALIKNDKNGLDIISEPIPEWIDPVAFAIFDCYDYSLCADYRPPQDETEPQFTFSTKVIKNPYKQNEDDPETIDMRIATQM